MSRSTRALVILRDHNLITLRDEFDSFTGSATLHVGSVRAAWREPHTVRCADRAGLYCAVRRRMACTSH
nr:hypothetical protein [Caballeronia sordidicola]